MIVIAFAGCAFREPLTFTNSRTGESYQFTLRSSSADWAEQVLARAASVKDDGARCQLFRDARFGRYHAEGAPSDPQDPDAKQLREMLSLAIHEYCVERPRIAREEETARQQALVEHQRRDAKAKARRVAFDAEVADYDRRRKAYYAGEPSHVDRICPEQLNVDEVMQYLAKEAELEARSGIVDMSRRRNLHSKLMHYEEKRNGAEAQYRRRFARDFDRSRCKTWDRVAAYQRAGSFEYDPYCRDGSRSALDGAPCRTAEDIPVPADSAR